MEFFPLAVPRSESELSLIESLLIAYDIPFMFIIAASAACTPGCRYLSITFNVSWCRWPMPTWQWSFLQHSGRVTAILFPVRNLNYVTG